MRSGLHCTWKPLKARPGRMTLRTPVSQCLRGYPMSGFPSTGNQFSSRPVQDDCYCVMTGTRAIYHAPAGMRTPCELRRAPPLSACMCGRTVQLTVRHTCSTAGSKMRRWHRGTEAIASLALRIAFSTKARADSRSSRGEQRRRRGGQPNAKSISARLCGSPCACRSPWAPARLHEGGRPPAVRQTLPQGCRPLARCCIVQEEVTYSAVLGRHIAAAAPETLYTLLQAVREGPM